MKLPIKKEYLDKIKSGAKIVDYRDAHITFVCEETGETLTKEVINVSIIKKRFMPHYLQESGMFDADYILSFKLK